MRGSVNFMSKSDAAFRMAVIHGVSAFLVADFVDAAGFVDAFLVAGFVDAADFLVADFVDAADFLVELALRAEARPDIWAASKAFSHEPSVGWPSSTPRLRRAYLALAHL